MLFVKNFLKESPAYIIFIVFKVIASMISLDDTLGYNLNLTILTAKRGQKFIKKMISTILWPLLNGLSVAIHPSVGAVVALFLYTLNDLLVVIYFT